MHVLCSCSRGKTVLDLKVLTVVSFFWRKTMAIYYTRLPMLFIELYVYMHSLFFVKHMICGHVQLLAATNVFRVAAASFLSSRIFGPGQDFRYINDRKASLNGRWMHLDTTDGG